MATKMNSCYTSSASTHISYAPSAVDDVINKYSTMSASVNPHGSNKPSRKPPRRNIIQRGLDRIRLEYYRYEVTFGLYVMTPAEKLVANTFVMVVLSLLLWAVLFYFPPLLYQKLKRVVWLLTGHNGEDMTTALGIIDGHVGSEHAS